MMIIQPLQEFLCIGVHYQFLWEVGFLIISSIMMVAYQVLTIADVANGLLMYVAQAFLLAGSIFGLDYYVKQVKEGVKEGS